MQYLPPLAIAFAASFAAAVVAAALAFWVGGIRPNYRNIVAIPVGITIAEALRLALPMSNLLFSLVIGATVGVLVIAAQFLGARRGV